MSKYDEFDNLSSDGGRAEPQQLPKDLAGFEAELRMLQPVEPQSIEPNRIFAAAHKQDAASSSPIEFGSRRDWRAMGAVAVLSSALTVLVMIALRPAPEVVERIRTVHIGSGGDGAAANKGGEAVADNTDNGGSEVRAAPFIAWTPVGSRAAELRQTERLLRTDADRAATGPTSMEASLDAPPPPSFLRLRQMLNEI